MSIKCTICNTEKEHLTIFLNAETKKCDYVCQECQSGNEFSTCSLGEINKNIKQLESMLKDMEDTFNDPDIWDMKVPEELEPFAFYPKKIYKIALNQLSQLKFRKLEITSKTPRKKLLEAELQTAIEQENFEKAALLKKEIEKQKKKK